jgi:hypothetical protein
MTRDSTFQKGEVGFVVEAGVGGAYVLLSRTHQRSNHAREWFFIAVETNNHCFQQCLRIEPLQVERVSSLVCENFQEDVLCPAILLSKG